MEKPVELRPEPFAKGQGCCFADCTEDAEYWTGLKLSNGATIELGFCYEHQPMRVSLLRHGDEQKFQQDRWKQYLIDTAYEFAQMDDSFAHWIVKTYPARAAIMVKHYMTARMYDQPFLLATRVDVETPLEVDRRKARKPESEVLEQERDLLNKE